MCAAESPLTIAAIVRWKLRLQKFTYSNTNTPHLLDTPQLYFHSKYINSVTENDTRALMQLQADFCQVTAPLLCKVDTGEEGYVIP